MLTQAILLVIDDESDVLTVVEQFAQRFAFKVVSRTDARAALAELRVLKPDAVIVDLMMPDINGLDVLRAIRAIDPACQIILMTGQSSVDTAIAGGNKAAAARLLGISRRSMFRWVKRLDPCQPTAHTEKP